MLNQIFEWFKTGADESTDSSTLSEEHRRLACAALLIEVAIIDNEFDQNELAQLKDILEKQFNIPRQDTDDLITLAQNECTESTSMYQFTKKVNQYCTHEEKFDLIEGMWKIAFADGDLDKYEEYIIRKVADLIHVAHGDFIRAKHQAKSASFPG